MNENSDEQTDKSDSETVETIRHLHVLAAERFHERRKMEWRFGFTLWASLLALASFVGALEQYCDRVVITGLLGGAAVVFHVAFVVNYVQGPMYRDWQMGIAFDEVLRERVGLSVPELTSGYRRFWAHWWQVAITATLAVVVVYVATLS